MTLEIYKEHILDLYKNPHNKGNLKNPTYEFSKNNPICGDEIKIQILAKNNKIENIKGINLKFEKGKIYALMGPNGSGKSTLANVIMGNPEYKITKGKIFLNGKDITNLNLYQ